MVRASKNAAFVRKTIPHQLPYPEGGEDVLEAILTNMMKTFPSGPPHASPADALKDGIEIGVQIGLMMVMMANKK